VLVLSEIEISKLSGELKCSSPVETCVFYFTKGKLVHAESTEKYGQEAVYSVLSWSEGTLSFQETVPQPKKSITADDLAEIMETIVLLQNKGLFDHEIKQVTQPVKTLVPVIELNSLIEPVINPSQPVEPTNVAEQVAPNPQLIETHLLLPPGIRQTQLEDLLKHKSIDKQILAITGTNFTGYIFYDLPQSKTGYALGLFINGNCTDFTLHQADNQTDLKNQEAYQKLAKLELIPQICKVEERILKSYRALVACAWSQEDVPLSQNNFAGAITSFKQSARDGIILVYLDSLKLHYFFFFEGGNQVGVFGSHANTGQLQPLSAPLALPTADANARMNILLANPPKTLNLNLASLPEKSNQPFMPVNEELVPLPEAVNWGTDIVNISRVNLINSRQMKLDKLQTEKTTGVQNNESDVNPFDF
jgi:hypothetical protein